MTGPTVRARHGAVAVLGLAPPHDTVHYRIFHPARFTGDDHERLTGQLPPDPSAAPWPVVVILPGINVGPEGYRWLAADLAGSGYAVVTMALVGDTLPGTIGITPGLDLGAVRPGVYGTRPSGTAIGPLLGALASEHERGPLAGMLDLGRVVLGGHSGGGSVVLQSADPGWFPGVVGRWTYASHTMASTALGFEPATVLAVPGALPTLLLGAELDGVMAQSSDRYDVAPGAEHDPVARTFEEGLDAGRGDCHFAVVAGATHTSLVWPSDDTTARGFLDPPPRRAPEEIRRAISAAVRAFCDAVTGHAGWDELEQCLAGTAFLGTRRR